MTRVALTVHHSVAKQSLECLCAPRSDVLGLFLAVLEQPDPVAVSHVVYQAFHLAALSPVARASANTHVSTLARTSLAQHVITCHGDPSST